MGGGTGEERGGQRVQGVAEQWKWELGKCAGSHASTEPADLGPGKER